MKSLLLITCATLASILNLISGASEVSRLGPIILIAAAYIVWAIEDLKK